MAEETVESELGPESKGLLARLGDKLQEGKEATDELGPGLAGITTAVDMSGMVVASAASTGLSAVGASLSFGWDQISNENSLTRKSLSGIGSIMSGGWNQLSNENSLTRGVLSATTNALSFGFDKLTTGNFTTIGAIKSLGGIMGSGLDKVGLGMLKLSNIQGAAFKLAQRAEKAAKALGGVMTAGITGAAKKVGGIAKGILDILLEGAFLIGLWALMKWLEGPGFKWVMMITDYIMKVADWIGLLFTDPTKALTDLWNGILSGAADIGNWIWENAFVPMWAWFKEMFPGTADVIEKLWKGVMTIAGGLGDWIWEKAIKPIWDWLVLLFTDPSAAFDQLLGGLKSLGTWIWNNAILPLWNWLELLFTDPKAALAEYLKGITTIGKWLWDNAISPLWTWFETTFPDASAFLKEQWAAFMSTGFGKWLYDTLLKPFSDWLTLAFTNPTAALDEAWIFFKKMGTWLYDTMLLPFWNWVKKLFTDPTTALTEAFTFFTSIGDWIYTNALKPFWDWFKALFPDVAKGLEKFWTDLTAVEGEEQGGVYGAIMGMLRPLWKWFSNLLDFSSMEAAIASAINVIWLPWNIIGTLIGKFWNFIKGWFGFKEGEAEISEDFNLGKMIVGIIGKIADFFRGLFNIDMAALGRSILGETLYDLFFATDEEKAIKAKKKEIEDLDKTIDKGTGAWNWSIDDEKEAKAKAIEELAKMEAQMLSAQNAKALEKIPANELALAGVPGGGGTTIINNNVVNDNSQQKGGDQVGLGLTTKPDPKYKEGSN